MADNISINAHTIIPRSELHFRFARSGGPGGQNVNKVETRVELLFDVANSPSLSRAQRDRIVDYLRPVIDTEGILHIVSQESRSQWQNREEAVKKFVEKIRRALKPKKKRIATKLPRAAKERRLDEKKRRGQRKKLRSVID